MAASSVDTLNGLHELVAKVLTIQAGQTEEFITEDGEVEVVYTATPATLAIAAKFLKDNSITCAIEEDENLGKLEEIFSAKQKKGRLSLVNTDVKEA